MGEVNGDFDGAINAGEDERLVHEWEFGLPNVNDITPLNQGLVPLELLSAFNISPEPYLTSGDVNRASKDTISTIRGQSFNSSFKPLDENHDEIDDEDCIADEDITTESKKTRRNESPEEADSAGNGKTLKRARLVWTPQLHKRFVDVVSHLGIKNAVPKTIMQLMNVEGLTRENVASHLQKYRLYLKRMQGVNFDPTPATSSSDQVSVRSTQTPVPGNSDGNFPVTYGAAPMVPVPVPMMGSYNGFQYNYHNQYNGVMQTGNKFGSVVGYHHHNPPHVTPGDR